MRIASPWYFKSINFHLKFNLNRKIDLANRFAVGYNKYFDIVTDEVLITFSKVISSINETNNIIYHENIIKCKVFYNNKVYYYPIITFVDDANSVTRGYYLGFEKIVSHLCVEENKISVNNKFLEYIVNVEKINNVNYSKFETYPFILIRDWKFDDECKKNDIVSLNTRNYKVNELCSFDICDMDINKITKAVGIDFNSVMNAEKIFINDEFILDGIVKLA